MWKIQIMHNETGYIVKQEIAANYEKYIRARDPFRWRSIHQNLNSLGNSFCSDSNLAGASLCRYNYCTWQVWHETHICCQGMRKICSDGQKMKCDKMKFYSRWKCALQWCHDERDGVSNHRRLDCLLKRLFSRRSKKASKLHVTGLC